MKCIVSIVVAVALEAFASGESVIYNALVDAGAAFDVNRGTIHFEGTVESDWESGTLSLSFHSSGPGVEITGSNPLRPFDDLMLSLKRDQTRNAWVPVNEAPNLAGAIELLNLVLPLLAQEATRIRMIDEAKMTGGVYWERLNELQMSSIRVHESDLMEWLFVKGEKVLTSATIIGSESVKTVVDQMQTSMAIDIAATIKSWRGKSIRITKVELRRK